MKTYISLQEYAEIEGVTYQTARNRFAKGKIEGAFKEGKFVRIPAPVDAGLSAPEKLEKLLETVQELKEQKETLEKEITHLQKEETLTSHSLDSLYKKQKSLRTKLSVLLREGNDLESKNHILQKEVISLREEKTELMELLSQAPIEEVIRHLRQYPESFSKAAALISSTKVHQTISDTLGKSEQEFSSGNHLKLIQTRLLEERFRQLLFQSEKKLNIWYSGCENGMEIYSLAILCAEFIERKKAVFLNFEILASDATEQDMKTAMTGIYPESSLIKVPMELRKKYFLRNRKKLQVKVSDKLRKKVGFRKIAFLDADITLREKMDIILCKNPLHLLDIETKQRVVERFINHLKPNGFLMLQSDPGELQISNMINISEGVFQKQDEDQQFANN